MIAVGVSLLAAAFTLGHRSNPATRVQETEPASERQGSAALAISSGATTRVTAREVALQLQLQGVEQRLARLESQRGAPGDAASANAPFPALEPQVPSTPEEYEAARQRALTASQKRFDAANGSSDWGRQHEASYRSFRPKSGHVQSAVCRGEMCRLEVEHDTAQDAERFVDEAELDPDFANVVIRWFFVNREKTRRVLFIEPATPPRPQR